MRPPTDTMLISVYTDEVNDIQTILDMLQKHKGKLHSHMANAWLQREINLQHARLAASQKRLATLRGESL
jgi:hypothetical protein